jgi:predicted ATPase
MIRKLTIENFKSIGDRQEIDLKPITLLFGPNGAGKSSVIQVLHYLREIILNRNYDASRSEIGGEFIDLHGFMNIVHDRTQYNTITIGIEFDIDTEADEWSMDDWILADLHETLHLPFPINKFFDPPQVCAMELSLAWSEVLAQPYVYRLGIQFDNEDFATISSNETGTNTVFSQLNYAHPLFARLASIENFKAFRSQEIIDFVEEFDDLPSLEDEFDQDDDEPADPYSISGHAAFDQLQQLVDTKLSTNSSEDYDTAVAFPIAATNYLECPAMGYFVKRTDAFGPFRTNRFPSLAGQKDALPLLSKQLPIQLNYIYDEEGVEFEQGDTETEHSVAKLCARIISTLTIEPLRQLAGHLECLCYIGPVRSAPARGALPLNEERNNRWASGLAAWDCLNFYEELVGRVSKWLESNEHLDANYKLILQKYYEVDPSVNWTTVDDDFFEKKLEEVELVRKKRMVILDRNENGHHPHDVGFGLSQIIPILAASLSDHKEVIMVEQPELHIHPRLQANLGDLFITCAKEGKQFILETHSENLLLRLLRRIRNTHENSLKDRPELEFDRSQLAVIYVLPREHENNKGNGARILTLHVDRTGEFLSEWPDGFFEERDKELFE